MALIRPLMEYTSPVWAPCTISDIETLERIQHFALKISFKQWTGHYSEKLVRANIPTLHYRRNSGKVLLLHKIIHKLVDFPHEYIVENVRNHHKRICQKTYRTTFRPQTARMHPSFFPSAVRLYNKLPPSTIASANITDFKRQLKDSTLLSLHI